MSYLEFNNEAMALICIEGLVYGLRIVAHTSNGVFEFSSLNATLVNLKNQQKNKKTPKMRTFVDFR